MSTCTGKKGRCTNEAAPGRKQCQACIDYRRDLRSKRTEHGICIWCDKVAEPGRKQCSDHLLRASVAQAEHAEHARAAGVCVICGETAGGYSYCEEHRRYYRDRQKEHA